eukprot:1178167-Prorocentrum_minimum.AAC.1
MYTVIKVLLAPYWGDVNDRKKHTHTHILLLSLVINAPRDHRGATPPGVCHVPWLGGALLHSPLAALPKTRGCFAQLLPALLALAAPLPQSTNPIYPTGTFPMGCDTFVTRPAPRDLHVCDAFVTRPAPRDLHVCDAFVTSPPRASLLSVRVPASVPARALSPSELLADVRLAPGLLHRRLVVREAATVALVAVPLRPPDAQLHRGLPARTVTVTGPVSR